MIDYFKKNILVTISLISLLLIVVAGAFYIVTFWDHPISDDSAVWGTFGDYIGGTINTLVSLSSLIILAILTNTVSKQSSEENKNVTLLLKRIDSYEKLTDHLPTLNQIFFDLYDDISGLIEILHYPELQFGPKVKALAEKARIFKHLHVFLLTFNHRFGHLFIYDFTAKEFKQLVIDLNEVIIYFDLVVEHMKKRSGDFPEFPQNQFDNFNNSFGKILNNLQKELK
ncbi:hypothetical protein [Flavobacterium piscisymbiosum]|uniref:Phage abortive infection protein n=1 Tax=Flavobacterium piscisymbiosum TaxID=2893753 RepID=A0ABS8MLD3_9FLAO|nr:hypothetical protein [Flavobacterium sp. F-30]MCC9066304.1 hypothetical protein [Flavobacterium sp. F-30]